MDRSALLGPRIIQTQYRNDKGPIESRTQGVEGEAEARLLGLGERAVSQSTSITRLAQVLLACQDAPKVAYFPTNELV